MTSPSGSSPATADGRVLVTDRLAGTSLVECLWRRRRAPRGVAFCIEALEGSPVEIRAGHLLDGAERAARGLRALGVGRGDRVLIVLPTGVEFVFLLWATLRAGGVPVPAYPPASAHQLATFSARLLGMARASQARLVVVPAGLRGAMLAGGGRRLGDAEVVTPEDTEAAAERTTTAAISADFPLPRRDDVALIQFSSGSTGEPRGIILTHGNVLSNVGAFLRRMAIRREDVCVTWLPLYHDMGLIGTLIGSLLAPVRLVLIPPADFLRQPSLWFRVIAKHRASIGVAPQFAYNLCVRKVRPTDLAGTDLSSLRVLLNGAEPIQAAGIEAFAQRYRSLGLRPGVVTPCYGLAEGTLAASMREPGSPLRVSAAAGGTPVVSVGAPMDDTEVRIRDRESGWLPDGEVGEICIRGPSVCKGIIGPDGIVPATDKDGWLPTADCGFLRDGELYVTGRLKDVIIAGGRNIYPQDIEAVAAELPGVRPGRIASFGVVDPERATEKLVVVAETTREAPRAPAIAIAELRRVLLERFGIAPHDVVFLEPGQIPLTTSGKVRRSRARLDYESNTFDRVLYRLRPAAR